jgi:hypothetical protein
MEPARDFAAAVTSGHASKTVALVQAVLASSQRLAGSAAAAAVGLPLLRGRLQQEPTSAGRNRLLRDWLTPRLDEVISVWAQLGFPVLGGAPLTAHTFGQLQRDASTAAAGSTVAGGPGGGEAVVVFDFDETLTTKQVGPFDVPDAANRCLGGADRVGMLRQMLMALAALGVAATVLTFNTRFTASKVLGQPGVSRGW